MKLELYQIDAFTDTVFSGNPACVVPLTSWLPDNILLNIARENAVAETAFFMVQDDAIHLRWFTPDIEMDLCGHATLATAHCLHAILNYPKNVMTFTTASGILTVRAKAGFYHMDLPSRMPKPDHLPEAIIKALNIQPVAVFKSRDYVLLYKKESDIKNITIDRQYFDQINLDPGGVIVTAEGSDCDFVSRFFTPQASILEDPVTGSAHCSLIPFWSKKLGKTELSAKQLSERTGKLQCIDKGERVIVSGQAITYASGNLWIP